MDELNKDLSAVYNPIEQLNNLIGDIEKCIANKNDFVGFVLISIGIEFIGAINDIEDFKKAGLSESRFKNALSNFFKNVWYLNNQNSLFEDFRGSIIHQYRTGQKFLLTSKCVQGVSLERHLEKDKDGKYILVLEQLFSDFKLASEKLKTQLSRETAQKKIDKTLLDYMKVEPIIQDGNEMRSIGNASGTTSYDSYNETTFNSKKTIKKKAVKSKSKYIR